MTRSLGPARALLAARAAYVLGENSLGGATKAAPTLYPHQWSWDAGFTALGLARLDVRRAAGELDALFRGQWRNGMLPHIVFAADPGDYFPGPGWWGCAEASADAPRTPATSGLCQPPVHALAAERIVELAQRRGDRAVAAEWLADCYPRLLAWHRFLARSRTDPGSGLLVIYHGWESGLDNSPRWDGPYGRVQVGPDLPAYTRRDVGHVGDRAQRPTDREYDRYLWLVEEARRAGFDPERMRAVLSFQVGDVLFTAVFAVACDVLADLADQLDRVDPGTAEELRGYAARARTAVLAQVDPATGLAGDLDLRTGEPLRTQTVAGFAPLVAGGVPDALRTHLVDLLLGPAWAGHPGLRWPLPPSTSPEAAYFQPRTYWRGPVWPVMSWLLDWALRREGATDAADRLRRAGLEQLAEGSFAEYYEPFTGEPLGSARQSWTAAVALDWLLEDAR